MAIVKTSADREAELEARLAEIENQNKEEDRLPPASDPKEKTYEKRYADLRSHTSRLENELRKEINTLKDQLTVATKKTMDFPKTAEEVSAWATKYPEIYDTIVTIARQNAIDVAKETNEKVQAFEQREYEAVKERAKKDLDRAHPDFFTELVDSEDFTSWIETQPKYIYNALYENETDAASAIRAVDLYKADRGILADKSVEKPDTRKDAAQRIPQGQSTTVNSGQLKWTESKLAGVNWNKLTDAQLSEIEEAQNNPAFYDISGGAR